MKTRVWLVSTLGVVILILFITLVISRATTPQAVSSGSGQSLLAALWQSYKQNDWHSGQTIDPQANNSTTSEGQSYTMLRAVWSNDPSAFGATWNWTTQHLQRSDKLFNWQWGTQTQGAINTASDADTDIALALVMASARWHNPTYLTTAKQIISSIWQQEVVTINGQPYLTADNLEKNSPQPVLNPSYWSPYSYSIFANFDPSHQWNQLASQTLTTIQTVSQLQLGSSSSANLPPDWVMINRQTGQLSPDSTSGHDTNFGYDAFRTVWRVALDYQWYHSANAKSTLASFSSLTDFWNHDHKLYAVYNHIGQPTVNYESPAMYGAVIGYYSLIHPDMASTLYTSKLQPLYNSRAHSFLPEVGYYENNWVWFGVALYINQLPKLVPSGNTG